MCAFASVLLPIRKDTLKYISKNKPMLVTIENVDTLVDGPSGQRDVDVMCSQLQTAGYWTFWRVYDAAAFGSPATRPRLYVVAIFRKSDPDGSAARHADALFRGMQIEQMGLRHFVIDDQQERLTFMGSIGLSVADCEYDPPFKPTAKHPTAVWMDEHNTFFRDHSVTWPVEDAVTLTAADHCAVSSPINMCHLVQGTTLRA